MTFSNSMRIISLMVLACLLQACSAAKLAYNQAPTLAYLYLDGYVDFNHAQSVPVKAELAKFQVWHRQTQLPGYIVLLQKMQQMLPQDVTASQACDAFTDVRQKVLVMTDYAQTATASVAVTLTQQQLETMQRKFAKSNATWREDFMDGSAKDMLEKRQKSAVKRIDMLYGNVNDRQRSLMTQHIEKSRFVAVQSYAERLRRQKDVLQTLNKVVTNPQDLASSQQDVRNLLTRSIMSPDAAYRSYLEQVTQDSCANFAELHNAATPDQRKNAVQVLAGYEQDFKSLMAQK